MTRTLLAALALLAGASCQSITKADLYEFRNELRTEMVEAQRTAQEEGRQITEDEIVEALDEALAPIHAKVEQNEATVAAVKDTALSALPAPMQALLAAVDALRENVERARSDAEEAKLRAREEDGPDYLVEGGAIAGTLLASYLMAKREAKVCTTARSR